MGKFNKNISVIISTIGLLLTIIIFVYSTSAINKINISLFIGVISSLLSIFTVSIIVYTTNHKVLKRTKEILQLQKKITEITKNKKTTIFISYNHKDKHYAQKISKDLLKANFKIWDYDKEIGVGENIEDKISNALKLSDYFIYLISVNSINSIYQIKELENAINKNIKILPILLDKTEPIDYLTKIKYADLNDYSEGMEQLLNTLKIELE